MLASTDSRPGSKTEVINTRLYIKQKRLILKTLVLSPHQEGLWMSTTVISHDWDTPIKLGLSFAVYRENNSDNFLLNFTVFCNCQLRHLQELLQGSLWVTPNPGFILLALQYSQMICYSSEPPLRSWAELQTGRIYHWHSYQDFMD